MWTQEVAWMEPVEAAACLSEMPGLVFLDSAMTHPSLGRYSYVAADPFGVFTVEAGTPVWNGDRLTGDPLEALRTVLERYRCARVAGFPPFQGGAVGVFDYEFGWHLDGGPGRRATPAGETVFLGFYDVVVAFDHDARRAWLVASGWPQTIDGERRERAARRLEFFAAALARKPAAKAVRAAFTWRADTSRDAYRVGIERVKSYIRAGDIYQANIAQRFSADVPDGVDAFDLYRQLRDSNPATFSAFVRRGATSLLSSSPESFLRMEGRLVETRPIKGTARRAADARGDAEVARRLMASTKDRAENIMIVDLLRNDLSRVCKPLCVDVPVLCGLETYAGLHHLVSVVTGELQADKDALDLIRATFPGGSITGAPKLRAMDIIAEIEGGPRGSYCGCIGSIGFDGSLDLNIAIRTVVLEPGRASVQVGGGITILSDADAEYEETLTKAQRIFAAFASDTTVRASA